MKKFTFSSFSQLLLGRPLKSTELSHERLPKWKALPIFSSDALSSIGYGPEQIALVLVLPGLILYNYFPWIIAAIVALLFIITISYAQVIKVHPQGGGAYSIAKEYLGEYPALLAAASLCADYVLTVAVSVSSGTAALVSAWPELAPYQIGIDLFAVFAILMLINLRGLREASNAFVWPTYAFLITALMLAGSGLYQIFALGRPPVILPQATTMLTPGTLCFLLLLAFANGCSSMTGVEAIANGADAFREPVAQNAKKTIAVMAIILSTLLISTGFLIVHFGLLPSADRTLLSLLAETVWGRGTGYFIFQLLTMVILYLAANTADVHFGAGRLPAALPRAPRFASFLCQRHRFTVALRRRIDHRVPRQCGAFDFAVRSGRISFLHIGPGGSLRALAPPTAAPVRTTLAERLRRAGHGGRRGHHFSHQIHSRRLDHFNLPADFNAHI